MKLTGGDRTFKDALLRGTGRCFEMLATESARRKFRPLVMWACGRNLGYDTQIEGTRALFLGIYLYDTTRCSFCRERAVRELGRRVFLTREMAEECLHDANSDIRDYAKRFLSRRRVKETSNPV